MERTKKYISDVNKIINRMYVFCEKHCYFALLVSSVCLLTGSIVNMDLLKSISVGVMLLVICFLICAKVYESNAMTLLGVLSLLGHFFLAFIFNSLLKSFGVDSIEYHYEASAISSMLNNGVSFTSIPIFKQYFTHFVAVIYFILGVNRLIGTFIVGFFAVLAGNIIYKTCETAKMQKSTGYFSSIAIWFMPGFLFFTSDLLKDSVVLFMTALSFYLFAELIFKRNRRVKTFVLSVFLIIVVAVNTAMRFYVFIPIITGFGLSFLIYYFCINESKHKLLTGVMFISLIALFIILSQLYLEDIFNLGIDKLFESLNSARQNAFAYTSGGIKGYDISTIDKALKALPALCAHYLLQPFPSSWLTGDTAFYIKLLIPDMIVWYAMLPFVLVGGYISIIKKNFIGIAALGYLIVFLCVNGLLVGNVGAIYRYRLQFQEIAFMLTGMGISQINSLLKPRFSLKQKELFNETLRNKK